MWYNTTMAFRKEKFVPEEFFHIYNRGNNKQVVYRNKRDYIRFLFSLLYFQSPVSFEQISRQVNYFEKHGKFNVEPETEEKVVNSRFVELTHFVLMPNHFHLSVQEKEEGGISKYMQRILISFTKYANLKYKDTQVGHVFQGAFKAVHQADNNQILYLSAYIHRNPRSLTEWKNKEHLAPWSSFQDYTGENRWGKLLKTDFILDQFENKKDYKYFVDTSSAKDSECEDEIIDRDEK